MSAAFASSGWETPGAALRETVVNTSRPPKNRSCMNAVSKIVNVAPFRPPDPNSTTPVSLVFITGGRPGVASSTVSPTSKPPFSAVSTSSATWSGPVG